MEPSRSFEDLLEIMDRLRGPDGCPWDREQTYATLRSFLLEECYEVVDALDRGDPAALREELGDLLFQVVFLSRLAKEDDHFTAHDVVLGIARKMIRRHPHVFGEVRAETSDQVLEHWEAIKRSEKGEVTDATESQGDSVVAGIPRALPALMKAYRLGHKAARVGFDWERDRDVMAKVDEELGELRASVASGDAEAAGEELGDVFFTLAMLARRLGLDPEQSLEKANRKFVDRFRALEAEVARRGLKIADAGLELLDRIWNEIK